MQAKDTSTSLFMPNPLTLSPLTVFLPGITGKEEMMETGD